MDSLGGSRSIHLLRAAAGRLLAGQHTYDYNRNFEQARLVPLIYKLECTLNEVRCD